MIGSSREIRRFILRMHPNSISYVHYCPNGIMEWEEIGEKYVNDTCTALTIRRQGQLCSSQASPPSAEDGTRRSASADVRFFSIKLSSRLLTFVSSRMHESILLKYSPLVSFLKIHNLEAFQELSEKYCDIMN